VQERLPQSPIRYESSLEAIYHGHPGEVVKDPTRFAISTELAADEAGLDALSRKFDDSAAHHDFNVPDWPYAPPKGIAPFHEVSGTPVVYNHNKGHVARGGEVFPLLFSSQLSS